MKIRVDLLFRNGEREAINVDITNEESAMGFKSLTETVNEAFREGCDAVITFGDGMIGGHIVRVSDLSCVEITRLGDDE